ncbi:MAG: hypothetical protein HQK76_01635, partial [Desulfobacterales bacterium]|nr:hypothetical protein [Desulfobacterales bacterium]
FRYPGPKPQTIEAAILMIADAVEAASRTIHDPTPEKIGNIIRVIIEKKLADGQFNECDLSTQNIYKISKVLKETLEASFHSRIEYPWQKEEKQKNTEP